MTAASDALTKELEAWVDRSIAPYLERLAVGDVQPRPKVINDALWGSIRLHAWEVALLDTPILQRLRHLRQLGVVHWVYPSAGHSRLEHSLGVLHQTEQLLAATERTGKAGQKVFDDGTRKLLRLAALAHDCGHSVMSHVSEKFIDRLPGVEDLRHELHKRFRPRKRPSASEAFAAVIVQSAAFRRLLSIPSVGADFIRDVAKATRMIASFILGAPAIPESAFLTLLVNGAYDADKLDYMPRDCMMAGVPCPVDVRRVIETVRVLEVPTSLLPRSYPAWAGVGDAPSVSVLTLTGSGARVLDELAMARTLLYEKVYFHHKVRALEVMVRRALGAMPQRSVPEWLDLVDDELLVGDVTRTHFASVRTRNLLKRAVVLTAPNTGLPEAEAGWSKLMSPGEHERLRDALCLEAARVAKLIGTGDDALARYPLEVDAPPVGKIGLDQQAFVGDSVEAFRRANAVLSGQRPEAGRRAARQMVYVFAPESAVLPVFVASRRVLRERYGISLDSDAYQATRLDPDRIRAAEERLERAGYFEGEKPPPVSDARIMSHRQHALETLLHTSWSRLDALAVKFGQYQPYDDRPISPGRIADFLRQFETDRLARLGLLVLEAIEFKDRRFFAKALRSRLATAPQAKIVCPLGATGDSSAFLSYLMNDVPVGERRPVLPLELALDPESPAGDDGALLLWDDFCGRAGHAATAVAQWLAFTDAPLDESLVTALTAARKASFGRRDILIAFALARRSGENELRAYLTKHELFRVAVLDAEAGITEQNRLFDTNDVLSHQDDRSALQTFLQDRMRGALRPHTERADRPWSQAKLEERVLGYGNESHLLVFSYNVPTVTLTALWADGPGWAPLFPRRGKTGG